MGNGQSRSCCGEVQWWEMLLGVHPCLPAPTLHKDNLGRVSPVPAAGDAGDPLETGPQSHSTNPQKSDQGETPILQLTGVPAPTWCQGCTYSGVDAAPAFSPPVAHTGWHQGTAGPWKNTVACGLSDGDLTRHHFILDSMARLPSDS